MLLIDKASALLEAYCGLNSGSAISAIYLFFFVHIQNHAQSAYTVLVINCHLCNGFIRDILVLKYNCLTSKGSCQCLILIIPIKRSWGFSTFKRQKFYSFMSVFIIHLQPFPLLSCHFFSLSSDASVKQTIVEDYGSTCPQGYKRFNSTHCQGNAGRL